jgi:hypothetical protein
MNYLTTTKKYISIAVDTPNYIQTAQFAQIAVINGTMNLTR